MCLIPWHSLRYSYALPILLSGTVGIGPACGGGWTPAELSRFPGDAPLDPSRTQSAPVPPAPTPEPEPGVDPMTPAVDPSLPPAPPPEAKVTLTPEELRIGLEPFMLTESEVPKGLTAPKPLEVSLDDAATSAISARAYFRNTQDKAIEALYDSRIVTPSPEFATALIMENWQGFLPVGMVEETSAKRIGESCRVFVGEQESETGAKFTAVSYVFRVENIVVFLLAVEGTNVKGSGLTPKVLLPYAEKALARVKKVLE